MTHSLIHNGLQMSDSKQTFEINTGSAQNMFNDTLLLTLKTNISPLSMVTVSKSPSQIFGAWSSGSLGGRAGGLGGGWGGEASLMCGVTGSASGKEVVRAGVWGTGSDVGLGLGSGWAGGCRPTSVGLGDRGRGSAGEVIVVSFSGGEEEVGESLLGSWPGPAGDVGGASVTSGGPEKEKMERQRKFYSQGCLFFPHTST